MITLAAASENNWWWISLVGVVIGGLLTIISNFAATWWTDRLKRVTDRQQLAGAICGELKGILSLVEHRKIASILRRSCEISLATRKVQYLSFSIRQNYFEVFEKSVHRIGCLPPSVAADVAEVYVFMKGAAEDLKTMEEGSPLAWDFELGYMFLAGALNTIETVEAKGRALIPKLEREALRTIWQELEGS
jgi:hypothetical protein